MRTASLVLAALVAVAAPALAQTASQVYVWKDARGVTHYSQTPPANGRYSVRGVDRRTPTPSPQAPAAASAQSNEPCEVARRNLEALRDASANVGVDSDGDGKPDQPLTAEQRRAQIESTQANIDAFCNQSR